MSSELCKSCVHTKVCFKDKNLVGDVFVMGNPLIFDNKELYERYLERKEKGFPCEDYLKSEENLQSTTNKSESVVIKQQTNADRIRAMTDEELAEFLMKPTRIVSKYECEDCENNCTECVLEWLKEEVSNRE